MTHNGIANGSAPIPNGHIDYSLTNSLAQELLKKTELVKGNDLNSSFDFWVELLKKEISQGGNVDLSTLIDNNGETLLCLAIRNQTLWNLLSQEARNSLVEKSDIEYTYPSSKAKQGKEGDNYLHIAARAKNIDAFLSIFQKSIESDAHLLEYNEDHENPLHLAARNGKLLGVVKGMFKYLESDKTNPRLDSEKLENVKGYIKNALGNRCALSNFKRTPLDMVSKEVRKKVREIAGIKDSLICNKKFHLCLYIVGAIACTAALCLSLYFLYLSSQAFALSSMIAIASGGVTYLLTKVCGEIYDSYDASTLMEGVGAEHVIGAAYVPRRV